MLLKKPLQQRKLEPASQEGMVQADWLARTGRKGKNLERG
jgi:hypothetical protein